MPKVSVIIPSYNHENFISEAIESVLGQTFQDFEVVIVDDSSQDGTVDQIKKFQDNRIKLTCFEKNQGAAVAMNKCIEEAQGDYIAVLNSDDLFRPEKLEKQVKFLNDHPEIGAVFSYAQIIDEQGSDYLDENHFYSKAFQQTNKTRYAWLNHLFFRGNALCHPSVLIRKICYEDVGCYDMRMAQLPDYDFWIRLCMKYEIHIIPEKLIKFRLLKGEQNASGKRPETMQRYQWELTQVLKHFLYINNIDDLCKIFPKAKDELSDQLIPFYIANEALKMDSPAYKIFALNTMYQLMENQEAARILKSKHHVGYGDFIKLAGKYDLFNLYSDWITTLYINTGHDFNQQESIPQIIEAGHFCLTFNVSGYSNIKSLRWDPIENKLCKVEIFSVAYTDKSGRAYQLDILNIRANAVKADKGVFTFESLDPMIILPVEEPISSVTIQGKFELLNAEQVIKDIREEKDRQLEEKEKQLNELINSWRGSTLIRKAAKLFKKL